MDGFDRLGQVCFGARDCIYLRNQDQRQESIHLHLHLLSCMRIFSMKLKSTFTRPNFLWKISFVEDKCVKNF